METLNENRTTNPFPVSHFFWAYLTEFQTCTQLSSVNQGHYETVLKISTAKDDVGYNL